LKRIGGWLAAKPMTQRRFDTAHMELPALTNSNDCC